MTESTNATSEITKNQPMKFRLVEAEEVDAAPVGKVVPVANPTRKTKKGKSNWTQLSSNDENRAPNEMQKDSLPHMGHRNANRGGRGFWRGGRGGRRGGFHKNESRGFHNGVYIINDPKITAEAATKQIEYYFSSDNLAGDTFLRRHMDVEGYVPVGFIASFNSVYAVHQDYPSLLEALSRSEIIEVDMKNEKLRPRHSWKQWLWPNAEGGFGVPLYLKMSPEREETQSEFFKENQKTLGKKEDSAFTMKEIEQAMPAVQKQSA